MVPWLLLLLSSRSYCSEQTQLTSIDFFRRATEQLALGHDVQALGDFRKSLAADPEFQPAQYNVASLYLRLGLIDQALASSDPKTCSDIRCVEITSKSNAFLELSNEQALEEDTDCVLFSRMLEIAPKSVETLKARAQCQFSRGKPIDAIRDLTLVVQIDKSDSSSAARAAVGSFVLLDQRQQALQILRRCVSFDDDAAACKSATKQLRALQKLIEKSPPHKLKMNNVIKETRKLLKHYNIPRNGDDDEGVLIDNLRRARCQSLAERQNYEAAAKVCAQVRDLEPDFPPAILVQAHLEHAQGNSNQAYEMLSKILKQAEDPVPGRTSRIVKLASELHDEILMERRQPRQPQQQPDKDLYKVLGVEPTADQREIRKAYRQLSKTYHPDKYRGTDLDENQVMEKMQELNEAYEILSNDDKRKDYDDQRNGGGYNGGGFAGGGSNFGAGPQFAGGFPNFGGFGGFGNGFQNVHFDFK